MEWHQIGWRMNPRRYSPIGLMENEPCTIETIQPYKPSYDEWMAIVEGVEKLLFTLEVTVLSQKQFCSCCGAGVGKFRRVGEGTCPSCDPVGAQEHANRLKVPVREYVPLKVTRFT